MPIYEFLCGNKDCQLKFEFYGNYSEKQQKCPKCKAKAEPVWSIPAKRDPRYGIQQ